MTSFDLFIILAAIAIAVVIIKRAIWDAVVMIGHDFHRVFERLNSTSAALGIALGTLSRRLEKLEAMAEEKTAVELDKGSESSKPAWMPACDHRTPQYGCADCIEAAHVVEPEAGSPSDSTMKN